MQIRIVQAPLGEAPQAIREAWVGLVLPLVPGQTESQKGISFGVLTGPSHLLGQLWQYLLGRGTVTMGYAVYANVAVEILARTSPDTAAWWRENAGHMLQGNRIFLFDAAACQPVADGEVAPSHWYMDKSPR